MFQNTETPSVQIDPRRKRRWLRVLLIGLLLFIISTMVMFLTGNPNLYPTVILIGNFLVPVTFVAFLYDHQHFNSLRAESIALSFCVGGVLGVVGASVLESLLLPIPANPNQGISLRGGLLVGFIEETCKILAVMLVARRMNHGLEMDGLLLGGAVGMGFAALESTGYAFTVFLLSRGQVDVSIVETIIRGLLAPFGHGTWTAILGAVLFQQSRPHRFRITIPVLLTYLFVSVLHGLWDGLPRSIYFVIAPGIPISVVSFVLSVIGIVTLALVYKQAEVRSMQAPFSPTP